MFKLFVAICLAHVGYTLYDAIKNRNNFAIGDDDGNILISFENGQILTAEDALLFVDGQPLYGWDTEKGRRQSLKDITYVIRLETKNEQGEELDLSKAAKDLEYLRQFLSAEKIEEKE